MVEKISLDVDHYEPSDSEEDYTPREKSLIAKVRKNHQRKDESDEEVLGFSESEEDDAVEDGINQFRDTDSEANEEDDLPDSRAWGKKKRSYYNTDFVDKDHTQYTAEEEELAVLEFEEAKKIRQRLTKQLNENDFSIDVITDSTKPEQPEEETKLKTDLSDLSDREKQQLFKKDAPEFEGLVQDMHLHLEECNELLIPFLDYCKENSVKEIPFIQFVRMYNSLLLNYCTNVSFYLVLKGKRITIKNHPVVKRLVQVRKLIDELHERYDTIVKPQIEQFFEDLEAGNVDKIVTDKKELEEKKMLNIMKPFEENNLSDDGEEGMDIDEHIAKDSVISNEEEERRKRGITYQMSKNKGLTAHKKPENRNPRVKNRKRYRKAVISRKGTVREVRKELSRYGGETTGIKAFVKRSVSIK